MYQVNNKRIFSSNKNLSHVLLEPIKLKMLMCIYKPVEIFIFIFFA